MGLSKTSRSQETEISTKYVHAPRHVEESFLEALHVLDPDLEPRWNFIMSRWEIWRSGKYVMAVQTQSGDYCPLDNRIIQKLMICDTHRYASNAAYIESLHVADQKLSKQKVHEQDEFIRACVRDMKPLLAHRKTISLPGKD